MKSFAVTAFGRTALEEELNHRLRVDRPALAERLQKTVAEETDLTENAEYHRALEDQVANEKRILELEDNLARAEVVDVSKLSGDVIKFGATVTLVDEDTRRKNVWQIVGEAEADVDRGRISINSPIAQALIGEKKGSKIEVVAPAGLKAYQVKKVEWIAIAH